MYIDKLLKLSDAQALTATAVGTNVVDIEVARGVGNGEPIAVVFSVGVAADQTFVLTLHQTNRSPLLLLINRYHQK